MSSPGVTYGGSTAFGPFDVETFYNESPLINAGNTGTADAPLFALAEDSDYLDTAVSWFATSFQFTPFNITRVLPDGTSPGTNGDETEALLDIDYAHATAPGTPIHAYVSSSLYTSIQRSITDNVCGAALVGGEGGCCNGGGGGGKRGEERGGGEDFEPQGGGTRSEEQTEGGVRRQHI